MNTNRKILGWREYVALPDLDLERIKVKVDSGARTSVLHAEQIEFFGRGSKAKVRFLVFPHPRSRREALMAEAPFLGLRKVRSSTGHETMRPVIKTRLKVGKDSWLIEITLVNRDIMGFRMLLGRTAIRHGFLIDPAHSYLHSKSKSRR